MRIAGFGIQGSRGILNGSRKDCRGCCGGFDRWNWYDGELQRWGIYLDVADEVSNDIVGT